MATPHTATSWIAWWGAGLSTLLAMVKLWELWRDRFRVQVTHNFVGLSDIGNKVLIRNLSGKPLILGYWELIYGSRGRLRRRFEHIASSDYEHDDTIIAPYSTHILTFRDQDYFEWGAEALAGKAIFIRLHVAGRRPFVRLVYRP